MLAVVAATGYGVVNLRAERISFTIATGPSSGNYFPAGETIAALVSHPHGIDRCEKVSACGPEGLIATAQTSSGSTANVLAVNTGRVDSALAQSYVVGQAVQGTGIFHGRKQTHIRVIAALYPQDVLLVARTKSHIASVADLRGKRVSLGAADTGTAVTARAVLAAYRLHHVHTGFDSADSAAQKLQSGKIDAFFFVGATPAPLVQALLADGQAVLVPIEGEGAQRLMAGGEGLYRDTITPSVYSVAHPVATLSVESLWIVNDREEADVVYALTRALFEPANHSRLDHGPAAMRSISLKTATKDIPAPLHPGAERFYKEQPKFSLWPF